MTNQTPSDSVVTETKQMIARIVRAIDDDLERQADIQTGCDYWRTDECGAASADMNIVTSELASAIYLAMQSANTTGSDELVAEARETIFDSLYHLRRDDRAEIYHKRAEAMLAKLDAALSQPLGSQGGDNA